jgi:GT2 family glycosyltransferase
VKVPVSVIIPTYNRAHLIERAVQSVLAQCGPADEVAVVDDGSTDNTSAVLAPYRDRIKYLVLAHAGAGHARNAGIRATRNPLIAFLDSDDEWLPGKMEMQQAVLAARPDVLFCFSDFRGCAPDGAVQHHLLPSWHQDSRTWDHILGPGIAYSSLAAMPPGRDDFQVHIGDLALAEMQSAYISTITLVVRRQAGDALQFAEDVATFEDLECFGRLVLRGRAAYLDCETACNYGHDGPRLSGAETLAKTSSRLTILERVWGSDPVFLSRYREAYDAAIAETRLLQARVHLLAGNSRLAREELRKISKGHLWIDRMAAALSPKLLQNVLRWRKMVLSLAQRRVPSGA